MANTILCIVFLISSGYVSAEVDTYQLLMPHVWPHRDELYLCTPVRITDQSYYIVGFEPNATMHTAHHILLYGCSEPGARKSVWQCGEMANNEIDDTYETASPCRSNSQIIYAWARDAPSLQLPEDTGFLVGADSPIKYLVLQVHYMHRFQGSQHDTDDHHHQMDNEIQQNDLKDRKTDDSGIFLKYTKKVMKRQAGVLLLGTGGVIPPRRVEHMETSCTIEEDKVIHPFAFRTHTHGLGTAVSGYAVRRNENGDAWRELGKKNPQLPQMFYPVHDRTPIGRGEALAARCTMNNTRDHAVSIGPTNEDEMCNFYLMYWVENDTPLDRKYCFTAGPPYYYWDRAAENFNRIPGQEASEL